MRTFLIKGSAKEEPSCWASLSVVCWPLEVWQPKEKPSLAQDLLAFGWLVCLFSMKFSRFQLNANTFSVCRLKWQYLSAGHVVNRLILLLTLQYPEQ